MVCNKAENKDLLLKMKEPLVKDIYTADPSAHVFAGKLYIYPSHDLENNIKYDNIGSQFDMQDYHVFSITDFNSPIKDHGEVLNVKNVSWAKKQFWAPDAAYKNNTYYLYFPAKDAKGIFRIGVATSKKPYGPFVAQKQPVKGSYSMDPAVFVDDDRKAYMYFGGLMGGQLQCWTTGKYQANAKLPGQKDPIIGPRIARLKNNMLKFAEPVKEIKILKKNGKTVTMSDGMQMFFEGPWMHKYKGKYYLSYSTGFTRLLVYAISDNPYGPFTWQGVILTPVTGWTTHHSIVKYKNKWYLFYHRADSEQKMHLRRMCYVELQYNNDGTIKQVK